MKPDTRFVHFDAAPDDPFNPSVTPIYQTATFRQPSAVGMGQYDYTRSANPTRRVLEEQLARLEGGTTATAFNSGMAAITAVASLLDNGDEIFVGSDLYGGTYRLLSRILARQGIRVRYVDTTDLDSLSPQLSSRPPLVLIETPTNPFLEVTDIRALASLVHETGAVLAVDNSLMSPYLQQPLALGADVVIHSASKYLGGHSDATAGAVITRDEKLGNRIAFYQNAVGTGLAPFESWLLLRGMKTLALRLERQQASAARLAGFLARHPRVKKVYYPALPDHPGRDVHFRQARGGGGVISFTTGSLEFSRRLVEAAPLFATTVSFGGVGSSMSLPTHMSHASIPLEVRASRRFPEDLVRVSVGIEHPNDLLESLERALDIANTNTNEKDERPCTKHAY